MINLEWHLDDGSNVMDYDVHPRSQEAGIQVPGRAVSVTVWLGTVPAGPVEIFWAEPVPA